MTSIFGRKKDKDRDDSRETRKSRQEEERKRKNLEELFSESNAGTEETRTGVRNDRHESQRRRRDKDHHRNHADTHHTELDDEESNLELPPPEAEEGLCKHCEDLKRIVYIDPKTKKPYPQKYAQRPEICDHCGQVWPKNKPYSERMKRQIGDRLRKSRYNKKFSCGCDVEQRGLNGKKRALLIGINYIEQSSALHGCRGDVTRMKNFLVKREGFKEEDMRILVEHWQEYRHPTREEIIKGMEWLVKDAQPEDSLFLHYSGHGGQTRDLGFDEPDGKDEGIYPVDYHLEGSKGILKDDDMRRILTVPEGVQLTAIFDSCHSGSALDLSYEMNKHKNKLVAANPRHKREKRHDNGRIVLWSGCLDHQKSAETNEKGRPTGAMSSAFVSAHDRLFKRDRKVNFTYKELYDAIQAEMERKGFHQIPQLSATDDQVLNSRVEL